MVEQFPILIELAPLFGAIAIVLFGFRFPKLAWPFAVTALGGALAAALGTFQQVLANGSVYYLLGGWERLGADNDNLSIGIEYRVDTLNGLVLLVITSVAFLNVIYSRTRVIAETPGKEPHFYILSLLLVAGLCGMTITNDAFNLYVLIEIASLTSYALIAMGTKRAALSSFNYIIMGTIGASFYLLGVGYLYIKTGSLNMEDIRMILVSGDLHQSASIKVAFLLIMLGVWVKMAFFPLHGWLPNAYAYAPTGTGCLMAPLVTKVMVYVMIRMMLTVFGAEYVFKSLGWSNMIVAIAVIAIVAGSLFALSRRDIRKLFTYLIVAEVGYMVGGAWLADYYGMMGALYHIVSDAMMTFCLFLAAGIIILRTGDNSLDAFNGLFRKMPATMIAFTVAALSMIGLPPTCGFFSKWYLVRGGIESGHWGFVAALIFSSLINAIIFFRIFERAYLHADMDAPHGETPALPGPKTPWSMALPLGIASVSLLIVGLFNATITGWLATALNALNLPFAG